METQENFLEVQIAFEKYHAKKCNCDYNDLKRQLDRIESLTGHRYLPSSCRHDDWLVWCEAWQASAAQTTHEDLVPKADTQYFSHDFNGDGFKYHNTLDEARKEAEASLDWYRDQVADGRHVNDMGEFGELCYGIVLEQAQYSVDHVVTQKDVDSGESRHAVGTEILSLFLGAENA